MHGIHRGLWEPEARSLKPEASVVATRTPAPVPWHAMLARWCVGGAGPIRAACLARPRPLRQRPPAPRLCRGEPAPRVHPWPLRRRPWRGPMLRPPPRGSMPPVGLRVPEPTHPSPPPRCSTRAGPPLDPAPAGRHLAPRGVGAPARTEPRGWRHPSFIGLMPSIPLILLAAFDRSDMETRRSVTQRLKNEHVAPPPGQPVAHKPPGTPQARPRDKTKEGPRRENGGVVPAPQHRCSLEARRPANGAVGDEDPEWKRERGGGAGWGELD